MEEKTNDIKSLITLMDNPSQSDIDLIYKAYDFAEKNHKGQFRKNGEPYVNHLFETAKILAQLGMTATTISAGLLHDVVEDTEVTLEELQKEFGQEIAFLVDVIPSWAKIY
jgi:GTP pyrophosphokinase